MMRMVLQCCLALVVASHSDPEVQGLLDWVSTLEEEDAHLGGNCPIPASAQCANCNHGRCLVGTCHCVPGFSGADCNTPAPLSTACAGQANCFLNDAYGVATISAARHQNAQSAEMATQHQMFTGDPVKDKPWDKQIAGFANYANLPTDLGAVLEIGAGKYTQLQGVLNSKPGSTVSRVALLEPMASQYKAQFAGCTYKDGTMAGKPVEMMEHGGEQLNNCGEFDTVIMLNVLEHVQDAFGVLHNAFNAVKPGGLFVFQDQMYNAVTYSDNGIHPIRLKPTFISQYLDSKVWQTVYKKVEAGANCPAPTDGGCIYAIVKKVGAAASDMQQKKDDKNDHKDEKEDKK